MEEDFIFFGINDFNFVGWFGFELPYSILDSDSRDFFGVDVQHELVKLSIIVS